MSGSISSIDSSDLGNFYIVLLNESYKNVTGEKGKRQGKRREGGRRVEGQPWVPVGSTVGPRFLAGIRGSPQKIRQRWVPVALW